MPDAANPEKGDSPDIPLPAIIETDVVVLPEEVGEDGVGIYSDSAISVVKELRSLGVTAQYQHPQDSRTWIGEKGFGAVALSWIVGVASNAGWTALCVLLRQKRRNPVRIKLARCTQSTSEITWEWFEVEGNGADVANALERLGWAPNSLESGNAEGVDQSG
jgi:hypothetical protein